MKFELDDKVVVKHTKEVGRIVDMLGDGMVMLENDKGVRFPVFTDQIDYPYFEMFSKPKPVKQPATIYIDQVKKERGAKKGSDKSGVYFTLLPVLDKDVFDDDIVETLKIYLVNYNEESYHFTYRYYKNSILSFEISNDLEKGERFYVHNIPFEDLNDSPKFNIEFALAKPDKRKAPYNECVVKQTGKQFFKKIQETLSKQEASFAYELFVTYPDKQPDSKLDLSSLQKSGYKVYELQSGKSNLPPARSVVDLHIEKLVDNATELSNAEILDIQLRAFETWFDIAMGHGLKSMIFIHGVGEGVLKSSLHQALNQKSEVKALTDRYHPNYGYGATEVFFK